VSRSPLRGLLLTVVLCAACEARESKGGVGTTAASVRTVSAQATNPPPSIPPAPTIVTLTQSGGLARFGLVTKLRNGHICLTVKGDSLTDSTAVAAVGYNVSEHGDSSKAAVKALIVGYSRECADSLRMIEGRNYALHSATDTSLGEGIGIVGGIDTLTATANRAIVRFPNDSAHWSFDVCSSREGLHYSIDRLSVDSIVTLWDGYKYLGYDVVPDCRGARDIPRATEVKSLAAAWRSGHHDEETAMRLVLARWLRCSDDKDGGADADTSKSARPALPPMSALLEAAGSPGKLSAENLFVLSWFGLSDESCFDNALPRRAKENLAEARRLEPSSLLFQSLGVQVRADVSADTLRAEIHRRFDGRGEQYRYLADWLSRQF